MAAWIYEGELKDPNQEFFVESQVLQGGSRNEQDTTLWSGRYHVKYDMLPSFLDEAFAGKVSISYAMPLLHLTDRCEF